MCVIDGIAPINNNVNPNPIQQPGNVQNVQNVQNAQNAPGEVQPAPAEAADVAGVKTLVRELDILLVRAGKAAGGALDGEALAKTAKAAKLDKATVNSLRTAAKDANAAMRVLDSFKGAELADALVRNEKTGVVEWSEDNYVGKAVQEALDKQQQLSDTLAKLLNNLPKKATAEQQAALEEAMLQCDRRISEIETIVLELADMVEKGDGAIDANTQKRLDRRVVDLAGEKALEMHDRNLAIQSFKNQLAPIVAQLENYAANPGQKVPKAQLTTFKRSITEARNAIANAAKTGSVQVPKAGGGSRELFVDRTFLDEAAKLLGEAEAKLGKLRENVGRDMRRNFVEKEIPWIKSELLQPKFAATLRTFGETEEEREQTAAVAKLVEELAKLRQAMLDYADKPSKGIKSKIEDILEGLHDEEFEANWKKGIDTLMEASRSPRVLADPELRKAFENYLVDFTVPKAIDDFALRIGTLVWHGDVVLDHLDALNNNIKSSGAAEFSDAVRGVFTGEGTFSTLVEARVHGYRDGDIDPALDDVNVAVSRELGSGNFNTVTLVTFKDGTSRVFKPAFAGRLSAENAPILYGLDNRQQITRINRAVNATADALGLGDVMVKTTAGVHKGVFGMYMEAAPGVEGRKLAKGARTVLGEHGEPVALGTADIKNLPADQKRIVTGRMMRQFNRLQWFDVITGQGDRHDANYMAEVKPDLTVTTKGIDNDGSFGILRTGLSTFRLPPTRAKKYMDRVRLLATAYGTKSQLAIDQVTSDPGYRKLKDGTIEVDVSKAKSPILVAALNQATGFQNVAVPDEMDAELCDKLESLASGPARDALLKEWSDRLGANSAQYRTAVNRLDEAIARAGQLRKEGKVYQAEDWEGEAVQKRITEAPLPLDTTTPIMGRAPNGKVGEMLSKDYAFLMAGNLYNRDFSSWR